MRHSDNVAVRIAPQAAELRAGGMKVKAIAARLHTGVSTVERALAMTGAKLPADRFRCGHPKDPENIAIRSSAGNAGCRLCHNAAALRSWHRKQGRTPCRLAQFWPQSRITDHGSRVSI